MDEESRAVVRLIDSFFSIGERVERQRTDAGYD
jgi:hypothetical protein